ncbi:MAG: hypothetical protein Tp152SUR00d2C52646391_72 [Prokaryotic dsDNA virus sp.]|nr:MAG: hypothetical protein Tp152SUR00d2C52646391_72 [Prokaryotic dsDNA virus sp.]|tara:strand:- start:2702 stop:2839 length:138 start_codon:yes stop_codon:yes gene_type:complete
MNPCPRCNSKNTWDDETMWGCKDCGWMGSNTPSPFIVTGILNAIL